MSQKTFDWDKFFSEASFNEIRNLSPDLRSRRLPSSYSPDKKFFYLSSVDDYVETNNQEQIRQQLVPVKNAYIRATRSGCFSYSNYMNYANAYIACKDLITLCNLLNDCNDNSDEIFDLDSFLGVV
jgi:predicted Ser/Thr protein kinase